MLYELAIFRLAKRKLGDELYANDSDEHTRRHRQVAKKDAPVDRLQRRVELSQLLAELQQDGMVPDYSWSTDCDQAESDAVTLIPATVMAYTQFEEFALEYAEGPVAVYPISFEEYAEFKPSFRDRRAEQYNY